jgi:hypothetical protein
VFWLQGASGEGAFTREVARLLGEMPTVASVELVRDLNLFVRYSNGAEGHKFSGVGAGIYSLIRPADFALAPTTWRTYARGLRTRELVRAAVQFLARSFHGVNNKRLSPRVPWPSS